MAFTLTVENKGAYLHMTVEGQNTPENVASYLVQVHEECLQRQCPNVLIEENLKGPGLDLFTIYDIIAKASQHVWPVVRTIAYVDANPEHDQKKMQFAETTAVNRGVNVRLFATVPDAEQWMKAQAVTG